MLIFDERDGVLGMLVEWRTFLNIRAAWRWGPAVRAFLVHERRAWRQQQTARWNGGWYTVFVMVGEDDMVLNERGTCEVQAYT